MASRAPGRRWPPRPRPPALSVSPGPGCASFSAGEAGASAERTAAAPAVPSPARGWGRGRRPRAPPAAPSPSFFLRAAAHLEAAPADPWRPAWGRHLPSPEPGLPALWVGRAASRRSPRSVWRRGGEGPCATTVRVSALRRDSPPLTEARGPHGGCQPLGGSGTWKGDLLASVTRLAPDSLDRGSWHSPILGATTLPELLRVRSPPTLSPWKSSRGRPESYFSVASEAGQGNWTVRGEGEEMCW